MTTPATRLRESTTGGIVSAAYRMAVRESGDLLARLVRRGYLKVVTVPNAISAGSACERRMDADPSVGLGVWEHFTMADGLPDMKIECVFEDSRGVLWIGTHDRGVVRYEGDGFTAYNRRDGLSGDGVFSAIEDQYGHLWFGTNLGLSRYDGRRFEPIGTDQPCGFLWGRCIDAQGNLWFGADRRPGRPPALGCWDGQRLHLVELAGAAGQQGESIHRVVCDRAGVLWAGGDNLYKSVDRAGFDVLPLPTNTECAIQDLLARPNGVLWIATADDLWSRDEDGFQRLLEQPAGTGPVSLLEAPTGGCWLATYDGRLLFSDGTRFNAVCHLNSVLRGGFCLDHVGRLWVGTYGMGLYCYDATRVRVFRTNDGLPDTSVDCVATGKQGTLWTGTKKGVAALEPISKCAAAG